MDEIEIDPPIWPTQHELDSMRQQRSFCLSWTIDHYDRV